MSILIRGMKMPKTCDDCIVPLSKCDFLQKRAEGCPLVEIPTPHGRLVEEHYPGELKAKQDEGIFVLFRSADEDADRFILEEEEIS